MTWIQVAHGNFNPHHHAGGDSHSWPNGEQVRDFNPHHHAGGDVSSSGWCYTLQHFNPHHHAGGDPINQGPYGHGDISIHTTTQVVTTSMGGRPVLPGISIHTTTQVVTLRVFNNQA